MKTLQRSLTNLSSIKVFFVASVLLIFTSCKEKPTVSTDEVTNIDITSGTSGGKVLDDGNASVKDRGVCWNTNPSPTIANNKTSDGTGMGSFTSSITQLTPNTQYHVRAFATNSEGTGYGNEVLFTTKPVINATLTTTAAGSITTTTAVAGGNITDDGGGDITARGVCWSTAANPTISDSKTTDGTGTGSFTSNLTGLLPGTTYHVRAYATNIAGTVYGNDLTFTTLALPALTTAAISGITVTSAISGGNVTSDGGSAVTARGVCWSTSHNPTIAGSHTTDGAGTGIFTSNLTGLTPNTQYYVMAYATSSVGTAYGNEIPFTTPPIGVPTLSTAAVTSITSAAALSGGSITSDGGAPVTARGVCWSTASNPTIANSKTTNGSGTGVFASSLTGLTENTNYYVRAYATNSAGTGYGLNVSFTSSLYAALHDPILALQFNDDLYNHNMHIATDGDYYYTCNGGTYTLGKINKYTLAGAFVATYSIALDMRSIMFNKVDKYFYASGFESNSSERNVYKITNIQAGTFVKVYTNLYDYSQAGVAISDDAQYLFAFHGGTLKKYKLSDGSLVRTFTGLSYGSDNSGGDGAVAVDPDYIYTWNATTKTVYVYDQNGIFVRSLTLTNGDYGMSLSFVNGILFVSKDGNYSIGTWYGYNIRKNLTKGDAIIVSTPSSKSSREIDKNDSTK